MAAKRSSMKAMPMGSFMLKLTAPNPRKTSCDNCRTKKLKCDGSHRLCERRKNATDPPPPGRRNGRKLIERSHTSGAHAGNASTGSTLHPDHGRIDNESGVDEDMEPRGYHDESRMSHSVSSASTTHTLAGSKSHPGSCASSANFAEHAHHHHGRVFEAHEWRPTPLSAQSSTSTLNLPNSNTPVSISGSGQQPHNDHEDEVVMRSEEYRGHNPSAVQPYYTGNHGYNYPYTPSHGHYHSYHESDVVPDHDQDPPPYYPMPAASFTRPSFDPLVDILTQINRSFVFDERTSTQHNQLSPNPAKRQRISSSAFLRSSSASTFAIHPVNTLPTADLRPWSTTTNLPRPPLPPTNSSHSDDMPPFFVSASKPTSSTSASSASVAMSNPTATSSTSSEDPNPVIREWVPLTDPSSLFPVQPNVLRASPFGSEASDRSSSTAPSSSLRSSSVEDDGDVEWMILERFLGSKAESIIEVVDRESFLRKLETRLPVLRYAVCAYAAHHSYPKAPYHVARKYYMKARDLAKASIGKPSFQALQSLILLRALSMAMSDNMHGFFFLEAALKMSSQLELKVTWTDGRLEISSSRELEDDVDLKELRKCWMACYFHDRMGAIASGQPHFLPVIGGLHDEAILDAGSPVDLDSTSSSTTPQPTLQDIPGVSPSHSTTSATPTANPSPTPKSDPDPLDHLMKLLDIAFQIHRAAKKPITCEQELRDRWHHLESAEAALSSWAFGVPVWMLSEPTLDWCLQTFNSSSDTPIPWSALTVLFLYHSLRCFLHRPRLSLEAALTDAAGGVGGLGFGGHTDQSIVRKLEALGIPGAVEVTAESAFVVARTVAKILLADPGVRDMNPPMAFCLTTVSIGLGDLAKRRGTYLLAAGGMGGWKSPPQPRPIKDEPTQGKYSRLLAHTNPGMSPGPEGLGECLEGVEAVLAVMRNLLPYWNVMQFVMLLEGIMANVRKWEDDVVARMRG